MRRNPRHCIQFTQTGRFLTGFNERQSPQTVIEREGATEFFPERAEEFFERLERRGFCCRLLPPIRQK
jgi:hypothetical protein